MVARRRVLFKPRKKGARFFIAGEKRTREIGERQGLVPVGTVRLLARLRLEGHTEDTRHLVGRLRRELRFRVGEDVLERAIAIATRPI